MALTTIFIAFSHFALVLQDALVERVADSKASDVAQRIKKRFYR